MGGVLGRHAMLHGRPEVDVEYGDEKQAVDDQGDEDESHRNGLMESRLSRGDHMISSSTFCIQVCCKYLYKS